MNIHENKFVTLFISDNDIMFNIKQIDNNPNINIINPSMFNHWSVSLKKNDLQICNYYFSSEKSLFNTITPKNTTVFEFILIDIIEIMKSGNFNAWINKFNIEEGEPIYYKYINSYNMIKTVYQDLVSIFGFDKIKTLLSSIDDTLILDENLEQEDSHELNSGVVSV